MSSPGESPGDLSADDRRADKMDTDDKLQDDLSDNDSVLSEVDEAQFDDFDPANIEVEERRIQVDEDNVKLLGRHKRKRAEGEADATKKKKKEGRREKPKRNKNKDDDDDGGFGGNEGLGERRTHRKRGPAADGDKVRRQRKEKTPEDEQNLDPEERRRRALDRAMDAALKNPNRRRKKDDGIDLAAMMDEEIASLRDRMADAARLDVEARDAEPPQPAMHKLKLLPEVVSLMNRNGREIESAIVDPETNLLQSVCYFLEPLRDGSLPAYDIQRQLFAALARLPIDKDALISSGLGKVVLFYTKSKKPELGVKRAAERLLAEWTRPILKRTDDYRLRQLETRSYDPTRALESADASQSASQGTGSQGAVPNETPEQRRARQLALPVKSNRARLDATTKSYSIVPQSNMMRAGAHSRPIGASGDDAFRRMQARQMAAQGRGRRT